MKKHRHIADRILAAGWVVGQIRDDMKKGATCKLHGVEFEVEHIQWSQPKSMYTCPQCFDEAARALGPLAEEYDRENGIKSSGPVLDRKQGGSFDDDDGEQFDGDDFAGFGDGGIDTAAH